MDIPIPYNWDLEAVVLPQNEMIENSLKELVAF
jgi:hypothetical protein